MMDEFAEDITTEILERLPTKDIARARTVCKTWRNIINKPKFLSMLLSREADRNKSEPQSCLLFLPRSKHHPVYLINQDQEHPLLFHAKKINFRCPNKREVFSRDCVNGLLSQSFLDSSRKRLYTQVCNPITRDITQLPDIFAPSGYHILSGGISAFVFDESTKQYKVLQIYTLFGDSGFHYYWEAWIHILGSNYWRKLAIPTRLTCSVTKTVAEIGGLLHWCTRDNIMTFNLVSEKFGSIEYSELNTFEVITHPCDGERKILNLGGYLTIVDNTHTSFVPGDDLYFEMWIMKKYNVRESWVKLKINYEPPFPEGVQFKKTLPLSFNDDTGDMFLCYGSGIVLYNTKSKTYTSHLVLCNTDEDLSKYCFDFYPFMVNLVPLPNSPSELKQADEERAT